MARVTEIRCQQACNNLSKTGLPYGWDMNIYRGCQHGCVYCYAIYSHDYISKDDYYEDIYVKVNIAEQLERQLSSPSWKGEKIGIGGVTDSYQPIEAKYKLMPKILRVLIKYKNPCSISTKSDLILRDYDLIDELSRVAEVNISASINIMDEEVRKKIEPGGKSAARRFNMLKEFSKTNAFTGVLQMPVIPYISDGRENIEELYANAAECEVDYLVRGVMYLRGKTRGVFFDFIRREYPELLEKLTLLYRNTNLRNEYKSSLYLMMNQLKSKYRLSGNYMNPTKKDGRKGETKEGEIEQEEYKQLSFLQGAETSKGQGSILIPSRELLNQDEGMVSKQEKAKKIKWDPNPFVELRMGGDEVESVIQENTEVSKGQKGIVLEGSSEKIPSLLESHQKILTTEQQNGRKSLTAKEKGETINSEDQWSQKAVEIPQTNQIKGEPIHGVGDEKRARFYSMRLIARENMSFYTDQAKIFYDQGKFMEDFEDDYERVMPFTVHYPYYQRMSVEQLRTYFTWRIQVRKGDIATVPTSYAFLYMYELLNQIGVESPGEGLSKLLFFWRKFREVDAIVDKYIFQWLKDYHIYYPLTQSFAEFVATNDLTLEYPTVFGYSSNEENSFDIFARISKYKVKESVFYTEENAEVISKCFYFILERFREIFREDNQCFEDLIFYSQSEGLSWSPFRRALFYPMLELSSRQVVISEKEVYICTDEGWQYKGVMLSEQGRRLMGYIMREMECSLRKMLKFKHKLTANPEVCSERNLTTLKEKGIIFPKAIEEWVMEFYRQYTRTEVKVDARNLSQIRKQALQTQEKLIVPEEGTHKKDEVQVELKKVSGQSLQQEAVESQDKNQLENIHPQQLEKTKNNDPWSNFKDSLTEVEREALKLLLEGQSIQASALERGIMLEVLIDGINEKAMDSIGDTLLETDDSVSIHEEYMEKLCF